MKTRASETNDGFGLSKQKKKSTVKYRLQVQIPPAAKKLTDPHQALLKKMLSNRINDKILPGISENDLDKHDPCWLTIFLDTNSSTAPSG